MTETQFVERFLKKKEKKTEERRLKHKVNKTNSEQ